MIIIDWVFITEVIFKMRPNWQERATHIELTWP
jgi:hypothetical protein